MNKRLVIAALALAIAMPLAAQPKGRSEPGRTRSEMRILGYYFDNFYYVTDRSAEEDVTGLGAELRAAYRPGLQPWEVFGHLGVTRYGDDRLADSFNARIGVGQDTDVHDFTLFLDQAENRPSFEVGNTFARADVTTLGGEYGWRFTSDWEVGAEGTYQRQRFDVDTDRVNDYYAFGPSIRYRGFGWRIAPEGGLLFGKRDVRNEEESYETADAYIQVAYMPPIPGDRLYVSLRYRDRDREYTINDPLSRNFGRDETRGDWTLLADLRTAENVSWFAYFSTESVDSSVPAGDFEVGLLLVGLVIEF